MLKQAYLRQLKGGDVRVIDIVMAHDQPEGQIRLRIKMANLLSMIINEHLNSNLSQNILAIQL